MFTPRYKQLLNKKEELKVKDIWIMRSREKNLLVQIWINRNICLKFKSRGRFNCTYIHLLP
jgi:hypothetical protein